jgi:hypothetical protein
MPAVYLLLSTASPLKRFVSQCYSKYSSLAQKIVEVVKMIFDPTEHTSRAQRNTAAHEASFDESADVVLDADLMLA